MVLLTFALSTGGLLHSVHCEVDCYTAFIVYRWTVTQRSCTWRWQEHVTEGNGSAAWVRDGERHRRTSKSGQWLGRPACDVRQYALAHAVHDVCATTCRRQFCCDSWCRAISVFPCNACSYRDVFRQHLNVVVGWVQCRVCFITIVIIIVVVIIINLGLSFRWNLMLFWLSGSIKFLHHRRVHHQSVSLVVYIFHL